MEARRRKTKTAESRDADNPAGSTKDTTNSVPSTGDGRSCMHRLCGFDLKDFSSWEAFVSLMTRPTDPASLAVMRIMYGLLMFLDLVQERGLAYADYTWGDNLECRFPLFNFLAPLPLQWMYMVYLVMIIGALGIMLGAFYRISCFIFCIHYWYIFFLDKTAWNNHSYLFGLFSFILLITDANRVWSIDGWRNKELRHAHVPLWNYTILRTQVFLVYFIAGLKKLDMDWMQGYSMQNLSSHWVFSPFKLLLTEEQIDLLIVHEGGLILDLTIGYFLFFDATRPYAFFFGGSFHLMNSQLFSIGMFPWTMLATMPLFCYADWPKYLARKLPARVGTALGVDEYVQTSPHCIYTKEQVKTEESKQDAGRKMGPGSSRSRMPARPALLHQLTTLLACLYLAEQCFMPYSHFITKGYNNWTNGLYGYSWDMMVHSWSTQHMRISYTNKETGEVGFLNPMAWTSERRWSSHADMMKQYATCISDRLQKHNISNVEIHFDIWRSLNDRFQQRMFDPREDLLTAEWHPFKETSWLMPLLTELSDWRGKLAEIEKNIYASDNDTDVVFIADFPGLYLENYIQPELGNTSIEVLNGEILVEVKAHEKNTTLKPGDKMQVPAGEYHYVHTVSETPSCYMYIFVNTTKKELYENITRYEKMVANMSTDSLTQDQEALLADHLTQKQGLEKHANRTVLERLYRWAVRKYFKFKRAGLMMIAALRTIATFETHEDLLKHSEKIDEALMHEELNLMGEGDDGMSDDVQDDPDVSSGDTGDDPASVGSGDDLSESQNEKGGKSSSSNGDNVADDIQDITDSVHYEGINQS